MADSSSSEPQSISEDKAQRYIRVLESWNLVMGINVSVWLDDVLGYVDTKLLSDAVVQEAEEWGEMFQLQDGQNILVVVHWNS